MRNQTLLMPAQLTWQESTPVSVRFEDFYFSTDDGLNESRYTFLEPNRIPERFAEGNLKSSFIIAETGFGTGLNFLNTWQAWKKLSEPKRPLHFFSIEKFPLRKQDLTQALSNWPELTSISTLLIDQYPSLTPGLHTLEFEGGKLRLSILFGDVHLDLSKLTFQADAWYLDGFAPKKNPEMWTDCFFNQIAKMSKHETTFSTFTSASIVRKSLSKAGFLVKKQEGFGKKREMIYGSFSVPESQQEAQISGMPLWSQLDPHSQGSFNRESKSIQFDVAIIGAGLAGLSTAYELAKQGMNVCIIEKKHHPVQGASGQTQLAMYAKLPSEANKLFHFIIQALNGSIRFYNDLQALVTRDNNKRFWHQTGLIQLAWNEKESLKQESFIKNITLPEDIIRLIDAKTASLKSGLNIKTHGLFFEKSGWLDPKKYATAILNASTITSFFNRETSNLIYNDAANCWLISSNAEVSDITARYVVIANSNDAKSFSQVSHLPSKPLRGQVTSIKHPALINTNTVICGEGYLCPAVNNWHHFGATFDLKCNEAIIKEQDISSNIKGLRNWLPEWLNQEVVDTGEYHHSAGLRCTTPDYLPIVGPAPQADKMIADFGKLRVDSNTCKDKYGTYYPNLFVNIGHGSKGLFTSPLAAQIIRYYICGGLPPCLDQHRLMLSPARFLIKHLTQRRI